MSGGLRLLWILLCLSLMAAVALAGDDSAPSTTPPAGPPKAKVDVVEDTIHGHKIADPYRWLEDASSADSQEYVRDGDWPTRAAFSIRCRGATASISGWRSCFRSAPSARRRSAGLTTFILAAKARRTSRCCWCAKGCTAKTARWWMPNQMSADGTVALDWWFPSDDGKYVAYGTSASGSENSTLHLIETATGKLLPDTIEHTRIAQVAWKKDNSGFYYGRNPKKGDVPEGDEVYYLHIFYHPLGTDPDKDPLIWGEGRKKEEILVSQLPDDDDRWLLLTAYRRLGRQERTFSSGSESRERLRSNSPAARISTTPAKFSAARFTSPPTKTRRTSTCSWSTQPILRAPTGRKLFLRRTAFCKARPSSTEKSWPSTSKMPARSSSFSISTASRWATSSFRASASIAALGGRWDRKEAFFGFQSFTVPPSVYQVELASRKTSLWDKVSTPGIDPSAYEVAQVWYTSKDGTKVPMFVFHKKGLKLDGKNPTLLTGYGGFNVSLTPSFAGGRYLWLEHGGVFAVANLRGGSEFGEDWHRAGMLDKKQNVFDDFIAAAEFLISDKITDKDHLAIQGGSNGGLLMGAMITQRPDLFRAVVCQVPLLDMLRYQNFLIAKFWVPEYGSAEDAKQFDWLYAYSPYHHVKAGHGISGDHVHDRGQRQPRRSHARQENGGADAGRSRQWQEQRSSDPAADRTAKPATARANRLPSRLKKGRIFIRFCFGSWE